jgi:4'-phosphopantetheinyl transferase
LGSLLSADEHARADRFRFEEDRVRFMTARGGLRRILSSYCSIPPNHIVFYSGSHGKPALRASSSALEFNVSHSGDYALIAVTSGVACGVDIECGRTNINEVAVAADFFCPREVEWLSHSEADFLRLWTVKEASMKAVGGGLSISLCDFDVTDVVEGKSSSITLSPPGLGPQTLWLSELRLVPKYSAAVATVGERRVIRTITML